MLTFTFAGDESGDGSFNFAKGAYGWWNTPTKVNLPRYPIPSRVDGGRPPQMATFREAGKSCDFYTFIIVIF